ncbi:VOC family protein [Vibrio sp.]|nr:VOC family protein [Vibrio sp.]
MGLRVVPELYCFDIEVSKAFFIDVLGFSIKYERLEEEFAYLTLNGVDLMLEGISGDTRKWVTGKLEKPLGRGINFQWDVTDIDSLYKSIQGKAQDTIFLEMESKSYQRKLDIIVQKQFIIQSPDGYLFRFCEDVI